jgi:hypothetical protein
VIKDILKGPKAYGYKKNTWMGLNPVYVENLETHLEFLREGTGCNTLCFSLPRKKGLTTPWSLEINWDGQWYSIFNFLVPNLLIL